MSREYAGWLIQKRGGYYRPNWAGYTSNPAEAGRYTRSQALREAATEPELFNIVRAPEAKDQGTFQERVLPWLLKCFGSVIAGDRAERNHRFLEEALELVQACDCTATEAHQLVDYVFGRAVGDRRQEVGGVMVTLAALCLANHLDMHEAGEQELDRIWTKVEQIRAKHASKPKGSPLPQEMPTS